MSILEVDDQVKRVVETAAKTGGFSPNSFLRRLLGLEVGPSLVKAEDPTAMQDRPAPSVPSEDSYRFPWMSEIRPDSYLHRVAERFNECIGTATPEIRFGARTESGMYVAKPNFVTVKAQKRVQNLRISVYGPTSRLLGVSELGLRDTRHPYASFIFDLKCDADTVKKLLRTAHENKTRA